MIELLFALLVAHAVADFPLQGDYLAKFKAPQVQVQKALVDNPLWPWCMGAHCVIHAGFVALLTSSVWLGLAEFAAHWLIDYGKCRGWLTFGQDQALHVACKVLWVALLVLL